MVNRLISKAQKSICYFVWLQSLKKDCLISYSPHCQLWGLFLFILFNLFLKGNLRIGALKVIEYYIMKKE